MKRINFLAVFLALGTLWAPGAEAQQSGSGRRATTDYSKGARGFPNFLNSYSSPLVPEPPMSNSERLHSLVREGKLMLSLDDAIALGLENNLDIAVARYSLGFAQTDLLRTKAGGAGRGVAGAFQSSAAFAGAIGGGVSGFSGGGTSGAGGTTGGGGATNVGSIGCCDPTAGFSFGLDSRTTPLGFSLVSGANVVNTHTSTYSGFYGQGFLTGTSYAVSMGGSRQSTSSPTSLFNPQVPLGLQLGINQRLLNGYGYRANAKFIRQAKISSRIADDVFRQQVITTVSQILTLYWDLVSFRENVGVAEKALALAEKTLSDNKRQVEIGTLAPIEVVRAESEVAARQQDLIVAQTSLQQQQELLKTALSKQVDKDLASVSIDPTDQLPQPKDGDIPPLDEALREAAKNRPELEQADLNIRSQEYTVKANRNSLLPIFDIFATYQPAGLAGHHCNKNNVPVAACLAAAGVVVPDGLSQGLNQTLQGRFPDYSMGASLQIPILNRSAQADAARALLEERQLRTQLQQRKNQVGQEVRNAEIAVIQARAQINAASKAVALAQQTLDAEQKKFKLGESTVFQVIQAQRDLATQEGNEVKARSAYAKALTQFSQATGTTLSQHNVEITDAVDGRVDRQPNIPGTPATTPAAQQATTPGGW